MTAIAIAAIVFFIGLTFKPPALIVALEFLSRTRHGWDVSANIICNTYFIIEREL